jgi:hypothetical protein
MPRGPLQTYKRYALVGGFAVGALAGLIAAGPHLRGSPLAVSLLVVGGGAILGALIAYAAVEIFVGSLARGDVASDSGFSGGGDSEGHHFDSHLDGAGHHDSSGHD